MEFEIYVLGGYSRSPRVRRAIRDYDSGKLTDLELQEVIVQETAYLCGVQRGAGMTAIQDPLVEIHDVFRPYVESWRGVCIDGLLRYFDNNFFYRVPVFVDRPDIQRAYIARRARLLRLLVGDYRIKLSIPGAVTFAYLSKTDIDRRELALEIARLYIHDLAQAQDIRIDVLQLDEPFLLDVDALPEHYDLAREYIEQIRKHFRGKLALALYFGAPREDCFRKLRDIPVDYVSISLCEYPEKVLDVLKRVDIGDKKLILGVVDSRSIMMEEYDAVKKLVEKVAEIVGRDRIGGVTTSAWLDLIPINYAIEKTILLGQYGLRLRTELFK